MSDRRSFLKQVLTTAGVAAVSSVGLSNTKAPETFNSDLLSEEEQSFLTQFKTWVDDCSRLVEHEQQQNRWLKDNQGIMEIAEQAQDWMPKAQTYMHNKEFRKQFLALSDHLTNLIEDKH